MSNQLELPQSWELTTIGAIAKTSSGGTPSRKRRDYFGGSIPWLKSGELKDNVIRKTEETLTEEGLQSSSAKIFPQGTLCIALYGATVGKLGILDIKAATNQAVCGISPFEGIEVSFLFYALLHSRKDIINLRRGGAQPNISQEIVRETPIPLPPSAEQKRIVLEIDKQFARLDEGVAALKRITEDLKLYRASVLKVAFKGRLAQSEAELASSEGRAYESAEDLLRSILFERRAKWEADQLSKIQSQGKRPADNKRKEKYVEPEPPITDDLSELPEGWIWVAWEQIGYSQNGRLFPSEEYQDYGIKLLRPGNLHVSGKVVWTTENTRYLPESWAKEFPSYIVGSEELVMNLTAQSLRDEFLGRVCLTGEGERCLLNQRIARLTPIVVLPKYLLWLFKSNLFRRFVDGLNQGSLIQHMFTSQLATFVLPLAPLAEQQRIVNEVERRLQVVDELTEFVAINLDRAEELRRSILKRAFTGRLVPQDPHDEPASVLLERIAADTNRRAEETMSRKKQGKTSRRGSDGDSRSKEATLFEKETQPSLQDVVDLIHRRPLSYMHMTDERSTVEDLFRRSHHDFASTEDIDRFFADLTKELVNQTIVLIREGDEIFLERGHA